MTHPEGPEALSPPDGNVPVCLDGNVPVCLEAPRADVYRAPYDVPLTPIGQGGAIVGDALRDRVDVLSAREVVALAAAGAWGTLDELSARAAQAGGLGSRAEAIALLRGLAERGVLASEAELVARLTAGVVEPGAAAARGEAAEVATLGIPTRDRAEALGRALESFGRDIAESGRAIEILVVDGAGGADGAGERTRASARELERRRGVRVRCVDRRGAEGFAEAIAAASGAPIEVVRRALVPEAGETFAAGAARNLLLLDAAGRCSLQVDDDVVCDLRRAPGYMTGGIRAAGEPGGGGGGDGPSAGGRARLVLRSFEDPAEMWFGDVADRLAPDRLAAEEGQDAAGRVRGLAALHERLLGRSAAALTRTAAAQDGVDLRRAAAGLLRRVAAGGRVVCTQLGVRGDAAIGATSWLLTLPQPARGRLLVSEAVYRRAITSRRLVRAVTAETLTDQEQCMALAMGLDGRETLPPFPPLFRNEDGLFGCVLAVCRPQAVIGHLPFTLAHEPVEARATPFDEVFEQVGQLGMNDVLAGLVSAARGEVDTGSPAAAVATLGQALSAWSEGPARDLFERVGWMLAQALARRLARIDALLRESRRTPSFWADDLERLAGVIRERAEDPARALPLEWRERGGLGQGRELARRRCFEYGQILLHWPAMWEAAQRLRERGIGPGR